MTATSNPLPPIDLQRFGYHNQPTILVLSFNTPLDPSRAQDVSHYHVVLLGGPGQGGSLHGHLIPIGQAIYNPITFTVTLYPVERLNVHNFYSLKVDMSSAGGLTGPTGAPFARDFTSVISRSTLVGSADAYSHGGVVTRKGQTHPRASISHASFRHTAIATISKGRHRPPHSTA